MNLMIKLVRKLIFLAQFRDSQLCVTNEKAETETEKHCQSD